MLIEIDCLSRIYVSLIALTTWSCLTAAFKMGKVVLNELHIDFKDLWRNKTQIIMGRDSQSLKHSINLSNSLLDLLILIAITWSWSSSGNILPVVCTSSSSHRYTLLNNPLITKHWIYVMLPFSAHWLTIEISITAITIWPGETSESKDLV